MLTYVQGVKEVTLLGQNVNSYRDTSEVALSCEETKLSRGFKTIYRNKEGGLRFTYLLERVSEVHIFSAIENVVGPFETIEGAKESE